MSGWVTIVITGVFTMLGIVVGFFLSLWKDSLLNNRNRKRQSLERHFDRLVQDIIFQILGIISGVQDKYGTIDATTLTEYRTIEDPPCPLKFGFEDIDEYQAFESHYPETERTWRELITMIYKQNEDKEKALDEIKEYIDNHPDLPKVKQYSPPNEEKITTNILNMLFETTYLVASGQKPLYDFSKLHVDNFGEFQIIGLNSEIVAISTKERVEKCKMVLSEIPHLTQFKERVQALDANASQIMKGLTTLAYKLKEISSYGLMSSKNETKFEANEKCEICKHIFSK